MKQRLNQNNWLHHNPPGKTGTQCNNTRPGKTWPIIAAVTSSNINRILLPNIVTNTVRQLK